MGKLGDLLALQLSPRDTRPTYEWLHEHVETYPPLSIHGAFDVSGSRHFIGPFDALDDERTREVNILAPPRSGKSLVGDGWCCAVIHRRPGPFLAVHQTDLDAKMMHHSRLHKMVEGSKELEYLWPRGKFRWDEFEMTNGQWLYTGGPSLSNLSSKPAQHLRMEEVWMWDPGRMGEAEARCGDFQKLENNKILRSSQAGPKELRALVDDDWYRTWNRCTPHEWESACLNCGKYYDPIFSGQRDDGSFWGLTWNQHKLANGDWDIAKCIPTIRFECPKCGQPSLDTKRTKAEWNRLGRYRQAAEGDRRRVGFHWESVIDFPWDELVSLWLDACNAFTRGNIRPKLQFYQKRRAIFKDEASLLRGGLNIPKVNYDLRSDWPEEVARFLTIDRQADSTYWWTVRAWSESKSRRLGFGKCFSEQELKEIQERFKIPRQWVVMDSGHEAKGQYGVYAMCCRNGWLFARGEAEKEYLHVEVVRGKTRKSLHCYTSSNGKPNCPIPGAVYPVAPGFRFSKAHLNQLVQDLIDAGSWEEPLKGSSDEMEVEYSEQMGSRYKMYDPEKKVTIWLEGKNDHARDCANMQALMALVLKLAPDPLIEITSESEKAV